MFIVAYTCNPAPLVPGGSFADLGDARAFCLRVFPSIGPTAIYDTTGAPPHKGRPAVSPSWAWVDGVSLSSGPLGLTITQRAAAMRAADSEDIIVDGPHIVDASYTLLTAPDGTVSVHRDTDEDGEPEDAAPGRWQFRLGNSGPFDAPYGDFRRLELATAGMEVQAADENTETPLLSVNFPGDTNPYPVPFLVPAYYNVELGIEIMRDTDPEGPFQGAQAYTKWHRYPPRGFLHPAPVVPETVRQADMVANTGAGGETLGRVFVSRPLTPLPADDGHSPGYFFRGVRGGYEYANKYLQTSYDLSTGITTVGAWYNAPLASLGTVGPFSIGPDTPGQEGAARIVQPGLRSFAIESAGMGFPLLPYAVPLAGVPNGTPLQSWGYQTVGFWVEAVYVYRDATGAEWEYVSKKTQTRFVLAIDETTPLLPTREIRPAPWVSGGSGGYSCRLETGRFIGDIWYPYPDFPYDKELPGAHNEYGFSNGDGAVAVFYPMFGAERYHYLITKHARNGGYIPQSDCNAGPYLPAACDLGPFAYQDTQAPDGTLTTVYAPLGPERLYLEQGQILANACVQVTERTDYALVVALGTAGTEWSNVECAMFPIFPKYANGGTYPGEVDTLEFTGPNNELTTADGPRPVKLVRHWGGPACSAGLIALNRDKVPNVGPNTVGPTTFGGLYAANPGNVAQPGGGPGDSQVWRGSMPIFLLDPQAPPFSPVADEWRVYDTTSLYSWRAATVPPVTGDKPADGQFLVGYDIDYRVKFPGRPLPVFPGGGLHLYALPIGGKGPITVYLASDDTALPIKREGLTGLEALHDIADQLQWRNAGGDIVDAPTLGAVKPGDSPFGYILLDGRRIDLYARPQIKV